MDRSTVPPRSSSYTQTSSATTPASPNASIVPSRNHGARIPPSAAPLKRGLSDSLQTASGFALPQVNAASSAEVRQPRLRPGKGNGVPGETWKDFLRETAESSRSAHRQHPFGDSLQRTGPDGARSIDRLARTSSHDMGTSTTGRKRMTSNATDDGIGKRRSYGNVAATIPTPPQGSSANPIIIASPPQQPSRGPPLRRTSSISSIVLPRWQPDHEVNECTVCGTPFSFLYRKHHCRKCGRVVCANCSPHRITIPRQFIVQPPPTGASTSYWPFGVGGYQPPTQLPQSPGQPPPPRRSSSSLFGGETVRVCNPCVPDPNFSPPPQVPGAPSTAFPGFTTATNYFSSAPQSDVGPPRVIGPPSYSLPPRPQQPVQQDRPSGLSTGTSNTNFPQRERSSLIAHPSQHQNATVQSQGHSSSLSALASYVPRYAHTASVASVRPPSYNPNAPLPPLPQAAVPPPRSVRQIREEDECPVCGRELPPKGPDGDESAREQHIDECIKLYSGTSGAAPAPPPPQPEQSAPIHVPLSRAAASSSSSAPRPAVAGPSTSVPRLSALSRSATTAAPPQASLGSDTMLPPPRPHQHRMLLYHATEKDCVGEDGERQECVICFEEFEEGDEMGRLDCLCKFHRTCIRQWWATKGVGSCPTHQLHQ